MALVFVAAVILPLVGCSGGGSGSGDPPPASPVDPAATRDYRAITGLSMGAYGALNLGTRYSDRFGVIGSLGGPVDLQELLHHLMEDNLEVKPEAALGTDYTFDHLPPYPSRDIRLAMMRDLMIALGNPFLHHPDPFRQYLAVDSEPALLLADDDFGELDIPGDAFGFFDGGDVNFDGLRQLTEPPSTYTQTLLLARHTLQSIAGVPPQFIFGERALADLNGDGIFDVGDGIVVNFSEPFDDLDGDGTFDPGDGETWSDHGLDGVPGTGDFGEGNGVFDHDPDRARWIDQDPLSRLALRSADEIRNQRIYMDVGIADEFGFDTHYLNLVDVLESKGIPVEIRDGFEGDCFSIPRFAAPFQLVRYEGGHLGIANADSVAEDLRGEDVCGDATIWQRLLGLVGFLEESFPGGVYGSAGGQILGDTRIFDLPSPVLVEDGGPMLPQRVVVYRPPAFFNTNASLPVAYFLGGYGQHPEDFAPIGVLFDFLVFTGQIQNMAIVFLPGEGGENGSFYVNAAVPSNQVPLLPPTTGRYEDSLIEDLIPFIENEILEGRIRR